ncbi:MAG: AAA family ATPase [Marinilabiliaceae bacterium]|nr:AAA family ATPase [Marinilabiliaceae bacterium]
MEYITLAELNAFKNNKGTNQKQVSSEDLELINQLHKKLEYLTNLLKETLNAFNYKKDSKTWNPVPTGKNIKNYLWYRVYPTEKWANLDISLAYSVEDDFYLRIDSDTWDEELNKRGELLNFRKVKGVESNFSFDEILEFNSYDDLSKKIIDFYESKIKPSVPEILSISEQRVGLLASDNTGWHDDHIEERESSNGQYSTIWNSKKPSGTNKTIKELNETIKRFGYFDLSYIQNKELTYTARIIKIATKDEHLRSWPEKNEILHFRKSMDQYADDNKSAKIVFLCSDFKKVSPPVSREKLNTIDGFDYPRQDNLSPFLMSNGSHHSKAATQKINESDTKSMNHPLNQILFGPPGTGKTYNSIKKAIEIINPDFKLDREWKIIKHEYDRLVDNNQIVFITFHQSMSYEDFVEGIKPQEPKEEGQQVTYTVEGGVFKLICKEATQSKNIKIQIEDELTELTLDIFREYYQSFADSLPLHTASDSTVILKTVHDKTSFKLYKNSNNTIVVKAGEKKTPMSLSFNELKQVLFEGKDPIYKSYEAVVINEILNASDFTEEIHDNSNQKYVLIIDEINRGNVSAIFGELITLIEENKRLGKEEALKVTLPYSKKEFGVPQNLHIIGTMNTADRSVEALDTALRRRFSFTEMPPDAGLIREHGKLKEADAKISIGDYEVDLPKMLNIINNRINILLDKDHLIGHSFFMKVHNEESLQASFSNEIIPLLQEYFYGDYGKIALVLGEGFCKGEKADASNGNSVFAKVTSDYDTDGFLEQTMYTISDPLAMSVESFKDALRKLMNEIDYNAN